jgi:AMMECR1 domain-containing protein
MDLSEMQNLSVKDYGVIVVEDNKSGAILPNTK